MNPQERKIIDDLFDKLGQAEHQAGPREPIAEAHIRSRIENQPAAPYLMAQTIVMQQQALEAAQTRLAGLEDELTRRPAGGGFLSGLFGGGAAERGPGVSQGTAQGTPQSTPRPPVAAGSHAFGRSTAPAQPGRGGGFLAGAAQTAMGVAGGMLLGSMIGSAFGGNEAHAAQAAEPAQAAPDEAAGDEAADGGADVADEGGDFGDDGF